MSTSAKTHGIMAEYTTPADAIHAAEIGLHRSPDFEIMARAKQEARTIVTVQPRR